MSELMNAQTTVRKFRWQLLGTVSALALFASVYGSDQPKAADQDMDQPTIWVELGGQMDHISGQGDAFAPPFLAANPNSPVLQPMTPVQAQNRLPFSFGEDGSITFQPESSDWVFSASIRYGRSSNYRHVDHQTTGTHKKYKSGVPETTVNTAADFADTQVHHQESHAILDFAVGKDVGLGLFGSGGSSVLSLGIRFAQFASNTAFDIRARPDLSVHYATVGKYKIPAGHFHDYHATGGASRSFRGLGPSLSWNGSAPFMGNLQAGELTFDWGANAGLLFGKQKARAQHQESAQYAMGPINAVNFYSFYHHPIGGHSDDRSVTVPNVGAFGGLSVRYANAKVSLGYRADYFFGAIDGGVDTRKSETLGFYGPFASVSVGLGG